MDRVNGTYHETYRNMATGEITFEKSGPITDQSLHGRRGSPHDYNGGPRRDASRHSSDLNPQVAGG